LRIAGCGRGKEEKQDEEQYYKEAGDTHGNTSNPHIIAPLSNAETVDQGRQKSHAAETVVIFIHCPLGVLDDPRGKRLVLPLAHPALC
jgi:hypothetical protein